MAEAGESGVATEEEDRHRQTLWTADADILPSLADPSQHTTLMSGASMESLRRQALFPILDLWYKATFSSLVAV